MKISYNWLMDYLPETISPEKTAEILTSVGLEVEGTIAMGSVKGNLEGLIVGQITNIEKHPNADSLQITTVNSGGENTLQIICGAKNVALNQKVVVATIGTTLYPLGGEEFKIKKAKIRGIESEGMLCAMDEIGLGNDHAGIIVLPESAVIGEDVKSILLPSPDSVFEIGITPDRSDAMSHIGAARDVAAYISHHEKKEFNLINPDEKTSSTGNAPIKVIVNEGCKRYSGIYIKNVTIKESPDWLKEKLNSIGLAPINNIVDITNFVLHEYGQPLHAFDANKISSEINVKTLPENTPFITLDGKERKLSSTDLMICDGSNPLCIAGVYGGINSGISESTTNVFLESACFEADYIRKTSLKHGLRTDAAIRFEKGSDVSITMKALKRGAELILNIAGGNLEGNYVDVVSNMPAKTIIHLTWKYLNNISGKIYEQKDVKNMLIQLGYNIIDQNEDSIKVEVPYNKPAIKIDADIAHEIMRIDGLDQIEIPQIISIAPSIEKHEVERALKEKVATLLTFNGFYEIFTNSITDSKLYDKPSNTIVKLINNLSADLDIMRPSMLQNGLEVIAYNLNRKNPNLKFYEFGKTYSRNENNFSETMHLSILMCGGGNSDWKHTEVPIDFFEIKGIVEQIAELTGLNLNFISEKNEIFESCVSILIDDKKAGIVGKVSGHELKKQDIKQPVYFADIIWENLRNNYTTDLTYREISKFPKAERDLSIVVAKSINFSEIEDVTKSCNLGKLESVKLFDIFESEKLGNSKKSIALNFQFSDENSTLTDSEIDKMMNSLISAYTSKLNAEIRK